MSLETGSNFSHYPDDSLSSMTTPDPDGAGAGLAQTTSYAYDALGRVKTTTLPDAATVTNVYEPTGEVKKSSGARQYTQAMSYDYAGRMKTLTTYRGPSETLPSVTTWSYGPASGYLVGKTDAASQTVSYSYTLAGRLETRTWARGVKTTWSYTAAGEPERVRYSDVTPMVVTGYDRLGRRRTVRDAAGEHTYTYTAAGQWEREDIAGGLLSGAVIDPGYDGARRRTALSASWGSGASVSQTWGYDSAGRWSSAGQTVGSTVYQATQTYQANAALKNQTTFTSAGTTRLTTTRSWDLLNRLTGQTHSAAGLSGAGASQSYGLNNINQRTKRTDGDGSTWDWTYDALGQVDTAVRKNSAAQFLAGQQFDYDFDLAGNRTVARRGGDVSGANLRTMTLGATALNTYTSVSTPSQVEVLGEAASAASVTVNGTAATRQGGYYRSEQSVGNTSGPALLTATVQATLGADTGSEVRKQLIPPANASPSYDADGNLLSDGVWSYTWDGENRLRSQEALTTWPVAARRLKLEHIYDGQSRRVAKRVYGWVSTSVVGTAQTISGSNWVLVLDTRYLYEGWNVVAEARSDRTLLRSYLWGTDVSGTAQGAGGVGGLLALTQHQASVPYASQVGTYFVTDDGHGNVTALVRATDGSVAARYEYGPFGEPLRASGPMAAQNPMRFSTKYTDVETGLAYYGYRFYDSRLGRWLNRDVIGERGGVNLYGMVGNDPVNRVDYLGMFVQSPSITPVAPRYVPPPPPPPAVPGTRPTAPHPGYRPTPTPGHSPVPEIPLPPGAPADAYPPKISSSELSEQEKERRRLRNLERERLLNNRPESQPDNCNNGGCKPFAKRELAKRNRDGQCCAVIRYLTKMDLSKGYAYGTIGTDVGLFGPGVISTNGDHVGVICGEGFKPSSLSDVLYKNTIVYDNNIPSGTSGNFWVDGAYYVVGRIGFETFLEAHSNRIGEITIGGSVPK
jgi:RHS repeat-associated protein